MPACEFLIAKQMKSWAIVIAILVCAVSSHGQVEECQQEWPGHLVRSVRVKARWLPEFGSSPFRVRDLRNADSLVAKLKEQNPLSQHLLGKLRPTTVALIDQQTPPGLSERPS